MNGPHVLYAWLAGLVLALADGLVYAQLGAALPGSGGGYLYLREAFQPFGLGRLMGFLFIFQTILDRAAVGGWRRGRLCRLPAVRVDRHDAARASPDGRHRVRGDDGAPLAQHRGDRPARGRDARGRARDGRMGHRRRPLHVLAGAGLRLSAGGVHVRSQPAHERGRRVRAGDVQLRRLQPGLQHRRRDQAIRRARFRGRSCCPRCSSPRSTS